MQSNAVCRLRLYSACLCDEAGGAAARANLRSTARDWKGNIVLGDVIVAVDDQKVGTVEDLQAAIEGYSVGDDVKVGRASS